MMNVVASLFLAAATLANGGPRYRGVDLTPWSKDALATADSQRALVAAKRDHVNTVVVNAYWFQDHKNSTSITPDYTRYTPTESSVRKCIRETRKLGMAASVKPLVDLRDGVFRGEIVPSPKWWVSYRRFILYWAKIAQQEGAETFSVGCELDGTNGDEAQWRQTITAVRRVFKGKLTYACNFGTETRIRWWDSLDLIGVDAYYALTKLKDPTPEQLEAAWIRRAEALESWLRTAKLSKQILFTEVGYRSADGTNSEPWMWGDQPKVDLQEQVDCYEAMFRTLWTRSWWAGLFIWNWEVKPSHDIQSDFNYTPQFKPAEEVIAKWFALP